MKVNIGFDLSILVCLLLVLVNAGIAIAIIKYLYSVSTSIAAARIQWNSGSISGNSNQKWWWANGCDWPTIENMNSVQVEKSEECATECTKTFDCTHFTYTTDGICWLKQGFVLKDKAIKVDNVNVVCGINVEPYQKNIEWKGNWANGCDFLGKNLTSIEIRQEDCEHKCLSNPSCTHFSWFNHNGGICILKQGKVSKEDAIRSIDSQMCGIVIRAEPSTGCTFKFGRSYKGEHIDYSKFDYITIWINSITSEFGTDFNPIQSTMIDRVIKDRKIPLFYAKIIGFEAKHLKNIQDCDFSIHESQTLCKNGAQFIRDYTDHLVGRYAYQAQQIANKIGKSTRCIWIIEPDFWQYYGNDAQFNGTISGTGMRALFDSFVNAIKKELPNAIISWDVSPWIGEEKMKTWWSFFADSKHIDLINTNGGQAHGDSPNIKPYELTWSFMSDLTGKKIIADCGNGVGINNEPSNCQAWSDSSNLNARITDGVVALTEQDQFVLVLPTQRPEVDFCF